jgi:hypothetical protein
VFKVLALLLGQQHAIVEEDHPIVAAFVLDWRQLALLHNVPFRVHLEFRLIVIEIVVVVVVVVVVVTCQRRRGRRRRR